MPPATEATAALPKKATPHRRRRGQRVTWRARIAAKMAVSSASPKSVRETSGSSMVNGKPHWAAAMDESGIQPQERSSDHGSPPGAGCRRQRHAGRSAGIGRVRPRTCCPVVTIPLALETLLRIMLPLEAQELRELWVAGFDLLAGCPAVIGEVVAAAVADRVVDQAAEGRRRAVSGPPRCGRRGG